MTTPTQFLQDEMHHAQRHLTRLRRLQDNMRAAAQLGDDELAAYERLANNKAYRQLQRDELTYHQMWLRAHRALTQLESREANEGIPLEKAVAAVNAVAAQAANHAKPIPFRKPSGAPTRNQACPCGSGVKYKRCCGHPLRATA